MRLSLAAPGLVLALALAAPAARAEGEKPAVTAVSTHFAGRELRVTAALTPLPAALLARLASGLPTTAVWRIGLWVSRPVWWDGKKDERRYAVTATYRPVSGDYAVERRLDDKLLDSQVVRSRREAEEALTAVAALPCFLMGKHLLGKPLVVKVRCATGTGLSLGLVPRTLESPWRSSAVFEWKGEP